MKKRVLIISTSAGTGHVAAGKALEKAFRADERVAEVVHKDALRYTNKLFRDFYSKLYTVMIKSTPTLLGWFYKNSDEPWKTDALRLRLDRLNTGPLAKFIRDFNPDITVCTHFMPAGIISHLIRKKELDAHLSIVVTDFHFHAMWLSSVFHRYFVALPEMRAHVEALGLPPERVTISGIPIDPVFAAPQNRQELRVKYGLDPKRRTLLVSGGALGVGPAEIIVGQLKRVRNDVQSIVLCGKNEELQHQVAEAIGDDPRFKVLGYSDRMFELMKMSDLFIGKPGGLTTSEALACGLPMLIVSPIPGQEEYNSDHLLEEGVAVKADAFTTIPYKVDLLLDDPDRLELMRYRAAKLGKPNAARTIVDTLLEDELPPLQIEDEQKEEIAQVAAGEVIAG
ncbi:MAG TPA: glycosyltransferase [Chthoniobacterales bacterium]|nr:glycosyltransferase [Chthoniobacterales bacterium]